VGKSSLERLTKTEDSEMESGFRFPRERSSPMARLKDNQVPSYRLHKQSGQAIVTLSGKDHLLGTYNSAASEACAMRGCDIDTTGKLWLYRPESHKNEHREQERVIYLGPQAQAIAWPLC
jgi:hypothetical protein